MPTTPCKRRRWNFTQPMSNSDWFNRCSCCLRSKERQGWWQQRHHHFACFSQNCVKCASNASSHFQSNRLSVRSEFLDTSLLVILRSFVDGLLWFMANLCVDEGGHLPGSRKEIQINWKTRGSGFTTTQSTQSPMSEYPSLPLKPEKVYPTRTYLVKI